MKSKKMVAGLLALTCLGGSCFSVSGCDKPIGKMIYEISDDGEYAIFVGYLGIGGKQDFQIGDTYEGLPVKVVQDNAFANMRKVKSITIPDSVEIIGDGAFECCLELTEITLGNSVSTIGAGAFAGCRKLENIILPDSVKKIGNAAFWNCDNLTNVSLGNGLEEIGKEVFYESNNISYNIYDNLRYLGNEENPFLALVGVGDGSLSKYEIPAQVQVIASNAFEGLACESETEYGDDGEWQGVTHRYFLEDIYYKGSVQDWCEIFFCGSNANPLLAGANLHIQGQLLEELILPNTVKKINDFAFYGGEFTRVEIPESVKEIGNGVFSHTDVTEISVSESNTTYKSFNGDLYTNDGKELIGCARTKSRNSFTVPDGVEKIDDYVFWECTELAEITMPTTLKEIGNYAFWNCRNLEKLVLPNGFEILKEGAFLNCYNLTEISIPDSIISVGNSFWGLGKIKYNKYNGVKYLGNEENPYAVLVETGLSSSEEEAISSFTVPTGVRVIGESVFEWYKNLKSVTLPEGVRTIEDRAFSRCEKLEEINIPDSVERIEDEAFWACTKLKNISIPDSVITIGDRAFSSCENLENVIIGRGVKKFGFLAFGHCDKDFSRKKLKIKYKGTKEEWKAIEKPYNWKDYSTVKISYEYED